MKQNLLALAFGLVLSGAAGATDVTPAQARAIAKEAYIYGYPMLDQYRVMYAFSVDRNNPEYKGPFNTVLNYARVFTPEDKAFVTPNSDTPYSFILLDLRAEPIILTVPAIEKKRYFVFQMMDLYTYNFAYVGTRTTGNDGGKFLIAGPDWKGETPKGITKVIRSDTQLISLVGRTQLFNPSDLEAVKKIQAEYKVQPLSSFLGQPAPGAGPEFVWLKPLGAADQRTSIEFFGELSFLLQFCPTPPSETELRQRFASIGIAPDKKFDVASLSDDMKKALQDGMTDGQKELDKRRAELGGNTADLFGTRAFLKNNYVNRAVGAQVGIGANSKDEAMYPMYQKDADGQPFDGSKRYVLHFAKGEFPPVNAFWSVTMYNLPGQFLVSNPIDRYLINSPMLPDLKLDADGGLTIYIQNESPGKDHESNWLPAPKGAFMMAMRLYWPKQEALDGKWKAPPVKNCSEIQSR